MVKLASMVLLADQPGAVLPSLPYLALHHHHHLTYQDAHHEATDSEYSPLHSFDALSKQDPSIPSRNLHLPPNPNHRRPTCPNLPPPRIPSDF